MKNKITYMGVIPPSGSGFGFESPQVGGEKEKVSLRRGIDFLRALAYELPGLRHTEAVREIQSCKGLSESDEKRILEMSRRRSMRESEFIRDFTDKLEGMDFGCEGYEINETQKSLQESFGKMNLSAASIKFPGGDGVVFPSRGELGLEEGLKKEGMIPDEGVIASEYDEVVGEFLLRVRQILKGMDKQPPVDGGLGICAKSEDVKKEATGTFTDLTLEPTAKERLLQEMRSKYPCEIGFVGMGSGSKAGDVDVKTGDGITIHGVDLESYKGTLSYGGFLFGEHVDLEEVNRVADEIETDDVDTELEEDVCPQGHHKLEGDCDYMYCRCNCSRCKEQCERRGR